MSPELMRLIADVFEVVGPIVLKVVAWLFAGDDPIEQLAKERVSDIWPEVESERALAVKVLGDRMPELKAAVDAESGRGRHAEARRRET